MKLASLFKRPKTASAPSPAADPLLDEAGPVQAARTRARRRLMGAVVLLAVGVLVFPLLFETKPRPLAADVPIDVPARRDAAPARTAAAPIELPAEPAASVPSAPEAVAQPAAASAQPTAPVAAPQPVPAATVAAVAPPKASETPAPKLDAKPEPKPEAKPERKPEPKAEHKAEHKPEPKPEPKVEAKVEAKPDNRKADGERAKALLEGKPEGAAAAEAKPGRFVVQVGAFTDARKLREVRAHVEKLGLKTYTQSVETEAGVRTRVRVGPYTTRAEAEAAGVKLKAAGLPGNVLVL